MKTTGEWCFGTNMMSCALQLEKWQETNFRVCPKARFFNEKTGRMPKYYCAIQEQIEEQAGGVSRWVNVRTYDAVHEQTTCKFIGKRDEPAQEQQQVVIDAHEFAKWQRVEMPVKAEPVQEQAKPERREMTDDELVDEFERAIKPDVASVVNGKLSDAEMQSRAHMAAEQFFKRTGFRMVDIKRAKRLMAMFANKVDEMKEQAFKEQVKRDTERLQNAFTFDEHLQITYTPLVLQHVAWDYAIRARRMAADLRISETKKLCRSVDEIHKQWLDTLANDLDKKHRDRLLDSAKEWMTDTGNDQTILWLQVTQAYMTQRPGAGYRDLRVLAMCAILLAEWIFDYQEKIDVMVAERLHTELTPIPWPHLKCMVELMNGFIQDMTIERNQQIETCMRVMTNRMNKIKWIE